MKPECSAIREWIDSYVDGALAEGERVRVSRHLHECADCEAVHSQRLMLRQRLQQAVKAEEFPPFLQQRIQARLRVESARPAYLNPGWMVAAACLVVSVGVYLAYQRGSFRLNQSAQDAYAESVSQQVTPLMRVGLRDHVHCSVYRKYPENEAPKLSAMLAELGKQYEQLVHIVQNHLPEKMRLVMAHECRFKGRKFVHLTMKDQARLLSVIIARKEPGETFDVQGAIPSMAHSGIMVYREKAHRFNLAGFETSAYLVYVISDLPADANTTAMLAMAPEIRQFLEKLPG